MSYEGKVTIARLQSKVLLDEFLQFSREHTGTMQRKHDEYLLSSSRGISMKKVYEYVAYYAPSAEDLEQYPDLAEAIILDGKLIADSESTAKTMVIRMISTKYDPVIAKIKIEVRAFR